jgi:hypothetical protein
VLVSPGNDLQSAIDSRGTLQYHLEVHEYTTTSEAAHTHCLGVAVIYSTEQWRVEGAMCA